MHPLVIGVADYRIDACHIEGLCRSRANPEFAVVAAFSRPYDKLEKVLLVIPGRAAKVRTWNPGCCGAIVWIPGPACWVRAGMADRDQRDLVSIPPPARVLWRFGTKNRIMDRSST
jgi:hypothetical protein